MKPSNRVSPSGFHPLLVLLLLLLNAALKPGCCSERIPRELSGRGVDQDVTDSVTLDDDTDLEIKSTDRSTQNRLHSLLQLSHPKIVIHGDVDFELGDGYSFDLDQEPAYPRQMGGINIKEEARKLATKLRILSNEEMGITSMQVSRD